MCRRPGKGSYSSSLTGVSAGLVSARGLWWIGQFRVLQQVFHCHWRCGAKAHCRMTSMEFGDDVMSESALVCPQSRNDHLVSFREEAVFDAPDQRHFRLKVVTLLWSLSINRVDHCSQAPHRLTLRHTWPKLLYPVRRGYQVTHGVL